MAKIKIHGTNSPVNNVINSRMPAGIAFGYESKLATPTITQVINTITLSGAKHGSKIYYTTDGSTPTSSSTEYTEAFTIAANVTVKAISIDARHKSSNVASKACTYVAPATTPIISWEQPLVIITADETSVVHYTLDGTTPTAESDVYDDPITLSATTTVKAIAIEAGKPNSAVATEVCDWLDAVSDPDTEPSEDVNEA